MSALPASVPTSRASVAYRSVRVADVDVFYREAGPPDAPAVLLLHGFPTSSHMFRDLIPALATTYRVVAPDLPGFGFSAAPDRATFAYTFDHLAEVVADFTDAVGLASYALYVFDYGAPVGLRLAAARPERVTALVSQNGNAYTEGLSAGWDPIRRYWEAPTPANREALRSFLEPATTRWQYLDGVPDPTAMSPDGYTLDSALLARPGMDEIQLDLLGDYRHNVESYPDFQAYFRAHRPPLLAVWGQNDPFFLPAGAEAFRRDLPDAEVQLLDTGHFALETHHAEVAAAMHEFLGRVLAPAAVA
ncbi:hydrolase [Gemmatimonadetes bacterium T265]|nr:hydrolase [Gemmatimonadetes bacterium T265]